jgi:Sec-independent protein secretion pathway component TatC
MLWDQVEILRAHLLRSLIWLAIAIGIASYFTRDIIEFMASPIGGLEALKAIEVTESVGVFMRVALLCGIAFAFPYCFRIVVVCRSGFETP